VKTKYWAVIGRQFERPVDVSLATRKALGKLYDPDQPEYRIEQLSGAELVSALNAI
jgi:hypothetical protein